MTSCFAFPRVGKTTITAWISFTHSQKRWGSYVQGAFRNRTGSKERHRYSAWDPQKIRTKTKKHRESTSYLFNYHYIALHCTQLSLQTIDSSNYHTHFTGILNLYVANFTFIKKQNIDTPTYTKQVPYMNMFLFLCELLQLNIWYVLIWNIMPQWARSLWSKTQFFKGKINAYVCQKYIVYNYKHAVVEHTSFRAWNWWKQLFVSCEAQDWLMVVDGNPPKCAYVHLLWTARWHCISCRQ